MKVLLTVASVSRSHGGPARSVSLLAHHLAQRGVQAGLWAVDGSGEEAPVLPSDSSVCRLGGSLERALEAFGKVDLVHDNGLWLPFHHQLAKWTGRHGIPRIVSPRGMLEPWAMRFKRFKKTLAWWAYQKSDLASATAFHVTAEPERDTVRQRWPSHRMMVIPNGVEVRGVAMRRNGASSGLRTALFVGRLHPVKGLPMLFDAWARVRPEGWRLRVVGPSDDGYRGELVATTRRLRIEACVEFLEEAGEEEKHALYGGADLFVLPSHTENFGIVVAEAMAHGLPVITTQGTPWKMVEEHGCGWWAAVSADGLAGALTDAISRSREELACMGERGRAIAAERFSWDGVANQFIAFYREVFAGTR